MTKILTSPAQFSLFQNPPLISRLTLSLKSTCLSLTHILTFSFCIMERRIRSLQRQQLTRSEPFLKYLKPGALARLRDSKISARSHKVISIPQISPHRISLTSPPPSSNDDQPQVSVIDAFPCFSGRMYGPLCPQRKKLVAAKAILSLSSHQSGPGSDLPDPVIDVFSSDSNIVAAH